MIVSKLLQKKYILALNSPLEVDVPLNYQRIQTIA